jgi:hypothetical protein
MARLPAPGRASCALAAAPLLGVALALAAVVTLSPGTASALVLCLPLWAAAYAGFALLYAGLAAPPFAPPRQPDSDGRGPRGPEEG